MKFLLDTHTFLWFITNDPKLSHTAKQLLEMGDSLLFISIESIWEMTIKNGLGKLPMEEDIEIFIPKHLQINRIEVLPITQEHTYRVTKLPLHHRDPFDRILIAQSLVEELPLVCADAALDDYEGMTRIW